MKEKNKTEKRNSHSYKCLDKVYLNAKDKAVKKGTTLTVEIEKFVTSYAKK